MRGFRRKLKAAVNSDAVLAIAKEAGFAITAEDIQSLQSATDLSDDELEGVAGGGLYDNAVTQWKQGCGSDD